ncbi:hypothetical protein ABK040_005269 [Willaertia magna]
MSKYVKEDFDFIKQLGKGAYSEVYLTKFKRDGKLYATKIIKKDFIIREKKTKTVKLEKDVLNMLSHPNIISLFCTYQDKDNLYFALEVASGGELASIIEKFGPLTTEAARFYLAELIVGLEYMHSKGVLHRDLKPENLLLTEDYHLKITDFGTAKILQPIIQQNNDENDDGEEETKLNQYVKGTFVGTAHYVSPEVLKDMPQSEAMDIWALGVILYNFLTGRYLFDGESQYLIFQKITNLEREALEIEDEEDLDEDAIDFIRKVVVFNPNERLGSTFNGGYKKLKKHSFFKGINFETLQETIPPRINEKYPTPLLSLDSPTLNDLSSSRSSISSSTSTNSLNSPTTSESFFRGTIASSSTSTIIESLNDRWSKFLMKGESVVYTNLVIKRRRFTAKKRQLILTDKPRLLYVDAEKMILKGIIPWSNELYVIKKNSRDFNIQTPGRNYQLEDLGNNADAWYDKIEEVKEKCKHKK